MDYHHSMIETLRLSMSKVLRSPTNMSSRETEEGSQVVAIMGHAMRGITLMIKGKMSLRLGTQAP